MTQVNFCILMSALFFIPNMKPAGRTLIGVLWILAAIYWTFK